MKRTKCFTSLVFALLFLSMCEEPVVSAQGTVVNALIDYIMNTNKSPSSPTSSSSSSPAAAPSTAPAGTGGSSISNGGGSGSSLFDLYSQMIQAPPQATPIPVPAPAPAPAPAPGNAPAPAPAPVLSPSTTPPPPVPMSFFQTGGSGSSSSGGASDSQSFYNQLIQSMNPPPAQTAAPPPLMPPFADPFPMTQPPPTPKPAPVILPFVPAEWNLNRTNSQQSAWGAHAAWSHNTVQRGPTGWEHYRPQPRPAPVRRPQSRHPMSSMTMMPRVREMINKQAVQFGDLAYYQQHGCLDPTPKTPGPGGIRPTQTLWYGCQSPVSRMVCMRAGKRVSGQTNAATMMMSMMNPAMTATMERCLSPRVMNQMMFQGFSGGTGGGMNPMMMMAMSGGGGGGGMAGMMPALMMMMRNQQAQAPAPPRRGAPAPALASTLGLAPAKQAYPDPAGANTLISQAARIPPGAAQPTVAQSSGGGSLMSAFSSMLGLGNSGAQTSAPSSLPAGAASPGSNPALSSGPAPPGGGQPDCSTLMPLMMSRMMAAGEGLGSPEAMEAIGEMRKQFLPYSCQEMRIKYTGLPLRLCCPGRVDPPTVFDLFKAKNAGGA